MKIIIGLGNPGKEYEKTRHNAGYTFVDALQKHCDLSTFALNKKFHAEISEGICKNHIKTILVKPQTFMNLSGQTVRAIIDYYKISPEDLIIAHDDLDIEIGNYKISQNIRAAGHNGVQNIIEILGTQDFTRIRIGVEVKGGKHQRGEISGKDFVLQKFSTDESDLITKVINEIVNTI